MILTVEAETVDGTGQATRRVCDSEHTFRIRILFGHHIRSHAAHSYAVDWLAAVG